MRWALRWVGAACAVLAAIWVGGADGVDLRPWAAAATAAGLGAALAVRARRGGLAWDAPRLALGALVAWLAVRGATAAVAPTGVAAAVAVGAVACALAALVADWRARAWAGGAAAGLGACSGLALLLGRWAEGVRSDGLFGNPNLSASVALLGLASAPFVRVPLPLRWVLGAASVSGILASGSRAAALGLAAVAAVWLLLGPARRLARVAAAGGLVLALAGLGVRLGTDPDPLRWERLRIWSVALHVARDHVPWGTGPGGFADAAVARNFAHTDRPARLGLVPDLAESDLLQLAATAGLPGVALALWLGAALCRRAAASGPHAWGCLAALGVTSTFHTQLGVPVLAWTATLAVAAALPAAPRRRACTSGRVLAAFAVPAAALVGLALITPPWWLGGSPGAHLAAARSLAVAAAHSDRRLADAEALAVRALELRPGWAEGWRVLGALRATRAGVRHDLALWEAAGDAFATARACNPLDALAALEHGRLLRLLGKPEQARAALWGAVALEPNLVGAWFELGLLDLEQGRLAAARNAVRQAQRALAARPAQPSPYEAALFSCDLAGLARLAAALGEAP